MAKQGTTCPKQGTPNLRRARVGAAILADPQKSQASAIIEQGYSPSTARNPTRNGFSVQRCIDEAIKLDPSIDPGKLVQGARRVFHAKIEHAMANPETIASARFSEIARFVEVAEKAWSAGNVDNLSPRVFVDRLSWLAELQAELASRGMQSLPAGRSDPQDVVVGGQVDDKDPKRLEIPPMSDNV